MDFTTATIDDFEFQKVANIKGKSSRDDTTKKVEWFKTRENVPSEDAYGYKVRYDFDDDEVITVLFGKCTSTRSNRIKHSRIAYSSHKIISRGKYDHIQSLLKFVPNRIKHPRIAYSSHKISRVKYDHIQSLLKFVPPVYVVYDLYFRVLIQSNV